jgi:hypothetical protein
MSSKKMNKANKDESELVDYSTEDKVQDGINIPQTPSTSAENAQSGQAIKALLGSATWKQLDNEAKGKLIGLHRTLEDKLKERNDDNNDKMVPRGDDPNLKNGDHTPGSAPNATATLLTSDLKLLGGEAAMNFGFVPTKDQILKFKNDLESKAASNIKISIDRRNSLITQFAHSGLRNLLNLSTSIITTSDSAIDLWLESAGHDEFFSTILPCFTSSTDADDKLQEIAKKIKELLDKPETLSFTDIHSGLWFQTNVENFIKYVLQIGENSASYMNENRSKYLIEIIS